MSEIILNLTYSKRLKHGIYLLGELITDMHQLKVKKANRVCIKIKLFPILVKQEPLCVNIYVKGSTYMCIKHLSCI